MTRTLKCALSGSSKGSTSDELETIASWAEGRLWKAVVARKGRRIVLAGVVLFLAVAAAALLGFVAPLAAPVVGLAGFAAAAALYRSARSLEPKQRVRSVSKLHWAGLALPAPGNAQVLYDLSGALDPVDLTIDAQDAAKELERIRDRLSGLPEQLKVLEPLEVSASFEGMEFFGVEASIVSNLLELCSVVAPKDAGVTALPIVPGDSPIVRALGANKASFVETDVAGVVDGDLGPAVKETHAKITALLSLESGVGIEKADELLAEIETHCDLLAMKLQKAHDQSLGLIHELYNLVTHTSSWPGLSTYCVHGSDGAGELSPAPSTRLDLTGSEPRLRCPECADDPNPARQIVLSRLLDEVFAPLHDRLLDNVEEESDSARQVENIPEGNLVSTHRKALDRARAERQERLAASEQQRATAASLEGRIAAASSLLTTYGRMSAAQTKGIVAEAQRLRHNIDALTNGLDSKIRKELASDSPEVTSDPEVESTFTAADHLRLTLMAAPSDQEQLEAPARPSEAEIAEVSRAKRTASSGGLSGVLNLLEPSTLPKLHEQQNKARQIRTGAGR